ncbi:MAG: hypothetical protein Q7S74_01570 [Nanoarchaeota archaeon]|nr:hypothetical protein [Nanoarchaeota archaeon]
MTGFNLGNNSKNLSALVLGKSLNMGSDRIIKEFIPYAGNKDYFVQSYFRATNMHDYISFYGENVCWGIRRRAMDKTLEVIPVHDSFKKLITPEVI